MRIRQLINQGWEGLSSPRLALAALLLLITTQVLAFALPQLPVAADQSALFSRWLAEYRPQLGQMTQPLATLGLLTIRTSLALRLTLALIALIVAAQLDRLLSIRQDRAWTPRRTVQLLLSFGGLLIIGGWAGQMLAGWRDPEIIVWPDEDIVVAARTSSGASRLTLPQPTGPLGLWYGGYGHYVIRRGQRTGLEVEAVDDNGQAVPLLRAVDEESETLVRLTFTTSEPEAFFAIQAAELIFRLNQIQDSVQVQAYRSASGELLTEILLHETDTVAHLQLNGIRVDLTQAFLPRYEVIYNPGAAPEALGMILFGVGSMMSIASTSHRDREPTESPD
jgi:hypothetical protein